MEMTWMPFNLKIGGNRFSSCGARHKAMAPATRPKWGALVEVVGKRGSWGKLNLTRHGLVCGARH